MKIEYITHASIYLETDHGTFLTDPFFFLEPLLKSFMCNYPPRKIAPDHFKTIDYVFSSHIHDDHSHRGSIEPLKNKIKTYLIPEGKPDLREKIQSMGIKNILELPDKKTIQLNDKLRVTNFHDPNGVDSALIIEADGKIILHQNDARLSLDIFREMKEHFNIDYAFFPYTDAQELFPHLLNIDLDQKKSLTTERERSGFDYLLKALKILQPKNIFPYAFSVIYHRDDQWEINDCGRTHPIEFTKKITKLLPESQCILLNPGDIHETSQSHITPQEESYGWGRNFSELKDQLKKYKNNHPKDFELMLEMDPEDIHTELNQFLIHRLKKPLPEIFGNQTIQIEITGKNKSRSYFIDTESGQLSTDSETFPFLSIVIPAIIAKELMQKTYDPFMILYCYQIKFKMNISLGLSLQKECGFYISSLIALFDPDLYRTLIH